MPRSAVAAVRRAALLRLPSRRRAGAVGTTAAAVLAVLATVVSAPLAAASTSTQRGIDVSKWQSYAGNGVCSPDGIDWADVAGTDRSFVFIKATGSSGGTLAQDPCFDRSWAGATRAGIFRGAYHYAVPSAVSGSAARDARFFVAATGRLQGAGDLPPVLDLEDSGGLQPAQVVAWAKTWLSTVQQLTGRRPMIYTNPSDWRRLTGDSTQFAQYPLWIANWNTTTPTVPGGWRTWTVHQYTDSGRVAGISGGVDLNSFNGTAAQLRAFAHPATALSIATSGSYAYRGSVWRVSGSLSSSGRAVAGRALTLYRQGKGSTAWAAVARTRTSDTGSYRFDLRPGTAATFKVRYSGGQDLAASWSATRSETVHDRYTTSLTATTTKHTTRKGRALRVNGVLSRSSSGARIAGANVTVYERLGTGRWTAVRTVRTSAGTASYSVLVRPSRAATYRVLFSGTTSNLPTSSPVRAVRVR